MRLSTLLVGSLAALAIAAKDDEKDTASDSSSSSDVVVLTGTERTSQSTPTGSYMSYSKTIRVSNSGGSQTGAAATTGASVSGEDEVSKTSSDDKTVTKTTEHTVTLLTGNGHTSTYTGGPLTPNANVTRVVASATSSSATPTNTQPCNGYVELCDRKYSNITEVCAHNSPFVRSGSAAANQQYDVTVQLNDGIRMLQVQTHYNSTKDKFNLCHTSCDILNSGTLDDYLADVSSWVSGHPYDVITILLGNADYVKVGNYTGVLENSGLKPYLYEPPQIPMGLEDWPTLSELILTGKRVLVFMDYEANQTAVPYVMDEFSHIWETPFDPTDQSFPCTVQRPPGLTTDQAHDHMYMINHNLNAEISLLGTSLLVPNTVELNNTALLAVQQISAPRRGLDLQNPKQPAAAETRNERNHADHVADMWGRPPNRLNVDYYNVGSFNGSVFAVAAHHNNVTYRGGCCGVDSDSAAVADKPARPLFAAVIALIVGIAFA
ncbi:PLC-like phosphodiesterase [Phyllosticta citrichinensis]|uniref:PLC-like phosphodiesterase n=1 Tax=Phyllosticta citrichinensis TaxID=1130410 RepID=A0ABR1Y416_9PEZI